MNKLNYPEFIDNTNFKYLNVDEKYIIGVIICDYPHNTDYFQIMDSIPRDTNYQLSIICRKQDINKVLKDLTYKISSSTAEIKSVNGNQIDIDLINNVREDAINLRKEIQINNQEIFEFAILILFFSRNYKNLMSSVKLFQSKLYSKNLITNITNFRHLECYKHFIPFINDNKSMIVNNNNRLFTSDSLSINFPFYINNVFDRSGILFGFTQKDNKICNVDIFDQKYINSNICIFGSSGAGKSYFVKLLIIRHFIMGKKQIVFDIENEYTLIGYNLNSKVINFFTDKTEYYNILEIFPYEINCDNWYENKIEKIVNLLLELTGDFDGKNYDILKKSVIKTYDKFNITSKKESLYKNSSTNCIYINDYIRDSNFFPVIDDLISNIKSKKVIESIKINVIEKFPCLCKHSTLNMQEKLIIFNTNGLSKRYITIFLKYFLKEVKNIVGNSPYQNIIYIDEVWKYIELESGKEIYRIIFDYYKTIRKLNSSVVTITQDITDFFKYNGGEFGKSILNNSGFKIFFRMEFSDKDILENFNIVNKSEINQLYRLNKGQINLNFGNNKIILNIKSSKFESEIMEG